jgi:DNA-binding CsgD family transcriptional regulator/tetratricopeptide (TPR) repeat protein
MGTGLLERDEELRVLDSALARSVAGIGSVVLLFGEAGIGKTTVVRAFVRAVSGRARVLAGACDDLLTPRTLGPIRDAARATDGPLAGALAGDERESVFTALLSELSRGPTVLVVEDAHWADEATLDVLRYLGRRVDALPAVLVVTYRDDEVDRDHPLQRVLGGLAGAAVHRLPLHRLSRSAVASLTGGTTATSAALYRLTGGNPFFVSEAVAARGQEVPLTVVDAVLARMRQLDTPTRAGLETLAVVPSGVELSLARCLLNDLTVIAPAERLGMLEVRAEAVSFRHELARRAVESALPATVRLQLNARVLAALLSLERPDLSRVVHHAVEAGDDEAVARHGPSAAREATAAGAHRQAVALYEQVLTRRRLLPATQCAALLDAYAWSLHNMHSTQQAVAAATDAVRLWEELGDDGNVATGLVTLARQQWVTDQPVAARDSAERALRLVEPEGDTERHALARLNLGAVLVLTDREDEGLPVLAAALAVADRAGALEPAALCHNYIGSGRLQLGDLSGAADLLRSVQLARNVDHHEYVMRGYRNLIEGLWRLGRYDEAIAYIDEADAYGRDLDFPGIAYCFEARRCRLLAMQGSWPEAETRLRALLAGRPDPGTLARETVPILARLLVRRGAPEAAEVLALARRHAQRGDNLEWLTTTGIAHIEHAWLTGRPEDAEPWAVLLLDRTERPGTALQRGELLRYLHRLGRTAEPFPDCPQPYAAGIRGDWRAAADAWQRIGDPYERALEMADSGQVEPTVEALLVLDRLQARPAAAMVRRRLRDLGMTRLPRGPQPATRTNPAGLTERQVEILHLLAEGLSNTDIAGRLVISVRTVDHHVAAVLQKLGVPTRREAARAAAELGLTGEH